MGLSGVFQIETSRDCSLSCPILSVGLLDLRLLFSYFLRWSMTTTVCVLWICCLSQDNNGYFKEFQCSSVPQSEIFPLPFSAISVHLQNQKHVPKIVSFVCYSSLLKWGVGCQVFHVCQSRMKEVTTMIAEGRSLLQGLIIFSPSGLYTVSLVRKATHFSFHHCVSLWKCVWRILYICLNAPESSSWLLTLVEIGVTVFAELSLCCAECLTVSRWQGWLSDVQFLQSGLYTRPATYGEGKNNILYATHTKLPWVIYCRSKFNHK